MAVVFKLPVVLRFSVRCCRDAVAMLSRAVEDRAPSAMDRMSVSRRQ